VNDESGGGSVIACPLVIMNHVLVDVGVTRNHRRGDGKKIITGNDQLMKSTMPLVGCSMVSPTTVTQ
jgi:hypothetical protein